MHINHTDIRRGDVEATEPIHRMKTMVLEPCTADEQALQIFLRDADDNELEVLKFREMKSARDIDPRENALPECSAAQRGREAEHGRWQRARTSSMKAELLELI
jgi:hypothetical protein